MSHYLFECRLRLGRAMVMLGAIMAGASFNPSAHAAPPIETPTIRVALGWTPNASQLPFIYGVDKGYYKEEGLDVVLDSGAGAGVAIQRVVSGNYQFGYADVGTVIRYDAENRARPVVAVYVAEDDSPLALFTLEGSGITRPKDIEGKRLGMSQFDGARLMLPVFAKANGVDLATLSTRTVDAQLREMMLTRGEVDVITGFTSTSVPLLTTLKQKFTVLRYKDFGVGGLGQSVIATPTFVAANPNTVRAFVKATNRSLKAMIDNPAEALAVLRKVNPLVEAQAETLRLNLMMNELILTPNVQRMGLSSVDGTRLTAVIKDVLATTTDSSPLAADSIYDARYLPDPQDRVAPTYRP